MSYKISVRKFLVLVFYALFSIFLLLITYSVWGSSNITCITYLSFVQIIISVITIIILTKEIINYSIIFILFCGIFFYGQLYVNFVGIDVYEGINTFAVCNDELIVKASIFALRTMCFIILGIILSYNEKSEKVNLNKKKQIPSSVIFYTGLSLFVIGILPKIGIDLVRLYLFSIYHYNLLKLNVGFGFLATIGNMAEYGIIIMIMSRYKSEKFARNLLILSIIYQLLPIMCGVRARSMVFIVMIMFFYGKIYKKFKVKNIIIYAILTYILLIILNVVSQIRQTGITWRGFWEAFSLNSSSSPIFTALEEFGNTICSVCYTIAAVPNEPISFLYRFNIVPRWLNAIPNIGGFLDNFKNIFYINTNFISSMTFSNSLGGSFLCELYFDQGEFGYVCGIFVGTIVGIIDRKIKISLKIGKIQTVSYILPLFANVLWWIRDNFIVIPREFLWTASLIFIFYTYWGNKMGKKEIQYEKK